MAENQPFSGPPGSVLSGQRNPDSSAAHQHPPCPSAEEEMPALRPDPANGSKNPQVLSGSGSIRISSTAPHVAKPRNVVISFPSVLD